MSLRIRQEVQELPRQGNGVSETKQINNNTMAKPEQTVNVNSISRISAGTVIKGEIISPNDIRIDGTFEGKVTSKGRVVLGESAVVKGDIICTNIDLWGKVDGNVYVKDTLSLKEGCVMNGNLHIRRLAVELGATFNGSCRTITEAEFNKLAGADAAPAAKPQPSPAN